MLVLGVLGLVAGGVGEEGPFGSMKRYSAETFSVSVPSDFNERLGNKGIQDGYEYRTYYGEALDKRPITVYVASSTDAKKNLKTAAQALAQKIAKNTNGDYKQLSVGESELALKGSQEIRFSFTNLRNHSTLGVVAYGRSGGTDVTVTILYPTTAQTIVESEVIGRVLKSIQID